MTAVLARRVVPVAEENDRSPVAARLVAVVFWREVVPVAVRFDAVRPPNKVTEEVAKAPRFVTEASVSASAAAEGQPTPFCRQIPCPATVAEAKEAKLAFSETPVAFVNERSPVVARLVAVVFWSEVVPVAVRFDVISPPKN